MWRKIKNGLLGVQTYTANRKRVGKVIFSHGVSTILKHTGEPRVDIPPITQTLGNGCAQRTIDQFVDGFPALLCGFVQICAQNPTPGLISGSHNHTQDITQQVAAGKPNFKAIPGTVLLPQVMGR